MFSAAAKVCANFDIVCVADDLKSESDIAKGCDKIKTLPG
ncbi:hypothetical protein A1E_02130 [Rickettsia canadensis str. McKiel]|uniref:Uncharacterized protein n=1 Tax=Rickettsia canadensis (strain McKiel) TaxID=293613 RepID=A8EYD8_RICCK|nr:hypothetical protein A1E_02130 [Rickettsia canadensis str. McKiel]